MQLQIDRSVRTRRCTGYGRLILTTQLTTHTKTDLRRVGGAPAPLRRTARFTLFFVIATATHRFQPTVPFGFGLRRRGTAAAGTSAYSRRLRLTLAQSLAAAGTRRFGGGRQCASVVRIQLHVELHLELGDDSTHARRVQVRMRRPGVREISEEGLRLVQPERHDAIHQLPVQTLVRIHGGVT